MYLFKKKMLKQSKQPREILKQKSALVQPSHKGCCCKKMAKRGLVPICRCCCMANDLITLRKNMVQFTFIYLKYV